MDVLDDPRNRRFELLPLHIRGELRRIGDLRVLGRGNGAAQAGVTGVGNQTDSDTVTINITSDADGEVHLLDSAVRADHRRHGIGRAVLDAVVDAVSSAPWPPLPATRTCTGRLGNS